MRLFRNRPDLSSRSAARTRLLCSLLQAEGHVAAVPRPAVKPRCGLVESPASVGANNALNDRAIETTLQNDIDDTCDGIGHIGRRCAIGQHIDSVQRDAGNDRRIILNGADTLRWDPHTIDSIRVRLYPPPDVMP